jgi:hypothetical protein
MYLEVLVVQLVRLTNSVEGILYQSMCPLSISDLSEPSKKGQVVSFLKMMTGTHMFIFLIIVHVSLAKNTDKSTSS